MNVNVGSEKLICFINLFCSVFFFFFFYKYIYFTVKHLLNLGSSPLIRYVIFETSSHNEQDQYVYHCCLCLMCFVLANSVEIRRESILDHRHNLYGWVNGSHFEYVNLTTFFFVQFPGHEDYR